MDFVQCGYCRGYRLQVEPTSIDGLDLNDITCCDDCDCYILTDEAPTPDDIGASCKYLP